MCIICLKPAGVDLPKDDEIEYMFQHNPHGAGFALQGDIYGDGRFLVEYHKGYMTVKELLKALGPRERLKNLTVAIHCRIKTSGETDAYTTHPFPISNQYSELRKLEGSGAVLFHNGVFQGLGGLIDPKSSDTQDFVVGIANRYLKRAKMPKKLAQAIIQKVAGECRVLVLYPNKNFPSLRMGTWHEHNGCFYSNTGYKDDERDKYYGYTGSYTSYGAYHYHRTNSSNTRYFYDEWGCNVADYAWPSYQDEWIRFDDRRWNSLMKAKLDEEKKGGEVTARFSSSGGKRWIIDEDYKEIYTPAKREDAKLRQDEEGYLLDMELEGEIYRTEDYIWFDGDGPLLEWIELGKQTGDFEVEIEGKHWYIDLDNHEAYTNEGLKKYFPSGQVGHVRKELQARGYYIDHSADAKITPLDKDKEYQEELMRLGRA